MICLLCGHNISSRWGFGDKRNHIKECVYAWIQRRGDLSGR